MRRPWWGPPPDEDQQAVIDLVDDLVSTHVHRAGGDDSGAVDAARVALAEHGLWTLGVSEGAGGGGADPTTTLLALLRLAGTWPALAWASVQAHAAALVLAEGGDPDLLASLLEGAPVAVVAVPPPAEGTGAAGAGSSGTGPLEVRLDAAHRSPRVVLLTADDTAVVLPGDDSRHGETLRRTGLDGALTHHCAVERLPSGGNVVQGPGAARAHAWLLVGAAALAAGIAEAAAQAALDYSRQREQFGAALTELPTVRASLAEQATTVRRLLRGVLSADPTDLVGAAAALGPALDEAFAVVSAAVQSHGGYGYMAEYAVEGMLRDVVSLRAASRATEEGRWAAARLVGAP